MAICNCEYDCSTVRAVTHAPIIQRNGLTFSPVAVAARINAAAARRIVLQMYAWPTISLRPVGRALNSVMTKVCNPLSANITQIVTTANNAAYAPRTNPPYTRAIKSAATKFDPRMPASPPMTLARLAKTFLVTNGLWLITPFAPVVFAAFRYDACWPKLSPGIGAPLSSRKPRPAFRQDRSGNKPRRNTAQRCCVRTRNYVRSLPGEISRTTQRLGPT